MLHRSGFYRIHDKFLVNISYVDSQTKGDNAKAIMSCGNQECRWNDHKLDISVRKKKEFENFILFKVNDIHIGLNHTLIAN